MCLATDNFYRILPVVVSTMSLEDLKYCYRLSKKWYQICTANLFSLDVTLILQHCAKFGLLQRMEQVRKTYDSKCLLGCASVLMRIAICNCRQNVFEYLKTEGMQVGVGYAWDAFFNNVDVFTEIVQQEQTHAFYSVIALNVGKSKVPYGCLDIFPEKDVLLNTACRRGNLHVLSYLVEKLSMHVSSNHMKVAIRGMHVDIIDYLWRINWKDEKRFKFITECFHSELCKLAFGDDVTDVFHVMAWIIKHPQIPFSHKMIEMAACWGNEKCFIDLLLDTRAHRYDKESIWVIDCKTHRIGQYVARYAEPNIYRIAEQGIDAFARKVKFVNLLEACAEAVIQQGGAWDRQKKFFGDRITTEVLKQITKDHVYLDQVIMSLEIYTTEQVDMIMCKLMDTPVISVVPIILAGKPHLLLHMINVLHEKHFQICKMFDECKLALKRKVEDSDLCKNKKCKSD